MKYLLTLVVTGLSFAMGLAQANPAAEALAKANACTACHAANERVVGPSFAEIAKRYEGKADAVAVLRESISKGSSGKWGTIPMPASAGLKAEELDLLAKWILEKK